MRNCRGGKTRKVNTCDLTKKILFTISVFEFT